MKTTTLLLATLSALATAQSVPDCAVSLPQFPQSHQPNMTTDSMSSKPKRKRLLPNRPLLPLHRPNIPRRQHAVYHVVLLC
jgi:hypothetical protein